MTPFEQRFRRLLADLRKQVADTPALTDHLSVIIDSHAGAINDGIADEEEARAWIAEEIRKAWRIE